MKSIYGMTMEKLEEYFLSLGEKKFKATQIYEWIYQKRIKSFDEVTNIKKTVIDKLKEDFTIDRLDTLKVERDVEVCKYLFALNDNERVESVLMRHDYGTSLCISSQVGCNMGCRFCESGRLKKVRNLESSEMVLQILQVEEDIHERISHVVIMGIGEPFDNYENVMDFIRILNHPHGLAIGARHITVSTCGIVPKIYDYAKEGLQINLAISLHAPSDEIRKKIMPISFKYPMNELMEAVKYYEKNAGRRVTFEYILLNGINDSKEDAKKLAKLIKGTLAYVNLIPYNSVDENKYKRSDDKSVRDFMDTLIKCGVNATIRREFGSDIDAACGQLRAKDEKEQL